MPPPPLAASLLPLLACCLCARAQAQPVAGDYADYLRGLVEVRPFLGPALQFSSYDRRSTSPGKAHWFANSDGFGKEPTPGFLKTLREPGPDGRALYLVAKVDGAGAIVRTWSAGMKGTLRVVLDGAEAPLFEGSAEEFLRAKSRVFLRAAGVELDPARTLVQEDADYLPIPFLNGLEITWEGKLDELHFYHVGVARGLPAGIIPKESFRPQQLAQHRERLEQVLAILRGDREALSETPFDASQHELGGTIAPGETLRWRLPGEQSSCIARLMLRCDAGAAAPALRGTLLRVRFDGASVPQIEAPLGDFFCSAPGLQPHRSLAFLVAADGWLTCRLPMPFARSCELELVNTTAQPVAIKGRVTTSSWGRPMGHDMHLHAKWRADHDLVATPEGADVPYVFAIGNGVLAGVACFLMNPSGVPTPGGSWWGEGDEKVWVDGEAFPSFFGTGSEDFYNYAWSRPSLFAHPHCGQPTNTGPGNSGYVTNYRFLIPDCVPFAKSLAFVMELKHHRRVPGFSYARIAYWYAPAETIDDHRALSASDLIVPELPRRSVVADGGAKGAIVKRAADLAPRATVPLQALAEPLAPSKELLGCAARGGEKVTLTLGFPEAGRWTLHAIMLHRADAARLRFYLDGAALPSAGAPKAIEVTPVTASACVQDVAFEPVEVDKGDHELVIEALSPGVLGLDTLWWRK